VTSGACLRYTDVACCEIYENAVNAAAPSILLPLRSTTPFQVWKASVFLRRNNQEVLAVSLGAFPANEVCKRPSTLGVTFFCVVGGGSIRCRILMLFVGCGFGSRLGLCFD